jgi:2-hydroxy-3-keto-5-methylthiopentenyl-1-phosphate phosphatase
LRPYAQLPANERPTLFYAGDGVSDLSAARETDLLFAKKGHGMSLPSLAAFGYHHTLALLTIASDLISYCVKEDVPFTVFSTWADILSKVQEIVAGKIDVKEAAKEGFELYKQGAVGLEKK